jgi:hypothetical protein
MIRDTSTDRISLATDVAEREDIEALTDIRQERRWGMSLQYQTSILGSQEEGIKVVCG